MQGRDIDIGIKVASPGSFVRDLAKFIDDLIKVAESEQMKGLMNGANLPSEIIR